MAHSWTFQKKVSTGFAVMVCLATVTAAVAVYALHAVVASKDNVISVVAENLVNATRLDAAADRQSATFRGFILSGDERFLEQRNAAQQEFTEVFGRLEKNISTDAGRRLLADVHQGASDWEAAQARVVQLRKSQAKLEVVIRSFDQEIAPLRDRLGQQIKAFLEHEQRLLDEGKRESTARASSATTLVVSLAALSVLFAAVTALFLGRSLSRQIGSAVQHVQSSSTELQSTANQQATGARETASVMNEVTTTMSELLVTFRQISESAQQVAHMAQETATAARGGDETVAKTQEAIAGIRRQVDVIVGHMLDLGKKSQQIGGILDIINELAEQTNILSINATIEAAGAGEAGNRFAVVGDEIRKLSERVTGSTREIRGLIEEVRAAVNTTVLATEVGSKAVDAGLQHFAEVTRGFKQIAALVVTSTEAAREIEISTKQQMTAVEQVNTAIKDAAEATRETEASTTQTLQTATQLAHLSQDLSRIVQPRAMAAGA